MIGRLGDRRLARIVRRCKQLPGQALFQYKEGDQIHNISSGDVNDYIASVAGERFTAKDFRSWHGTVEALKLICGNTDSAPLRISEVVSGVARLLGNTGAVCSKAYIHPDVLTLGQHLSKDGGDISLLECQVPDGGPDQHGLCSIEQHLLSFLESRQVWVGGAPWRCHDDIVPHKGRKKLQQ